MQDFDLPGQIHERTAVLRATITERIESLSGSLKEMEEFADVMDEMADKMAEFLRTTDVSPACKSQVLRMVDRYLIRHKKDMLECIDRA